MKNETANEDFSIEEKVEKLKREIKQGTWSSLKKIFYAILLLLGESLALQYLLYWAFPEYGMIEYLRMLFILMFVRLLFRKA